MSALTDTVDTQFQTFLSSLQTDQDSYYASRNIYFQGFDWSSTTPSDGNLVVFDQLDTTPNYQQYTWNQFLSVFPSDSSYNLSVGQYQNELGSGWYAHLQVIESGVLFDRIVNSGPDTSLEKPWSEVTPKS
jgi:hypothetical protein